MCLFPSLFLMLRRKRVPGVARGPAWRLMGVIFGTIFFLMFTPTKWIHHFGLFAAVGAAMAALATVLVSPIVLRSARNRMAFLSLVLFVLALCFASTNGWWYVSNFGVPFNNSVPAARRGDGQRGASSRCSRSPRCGRSGCTCRTGASRRSSTG